MFEQIKSGGDEISLDGPTICFILGWLPFIIAWGEYNTAFTEWLVQAYFLTVILFINYPRQYERKNLRKAWFWKAMLLAIVIVHLVILALMWFVDVSTKTQWHDTATMLSICAVAVIVDGTIFLRIMSFFRPTNEILGESPEAE